MYGCRWARLKKINPLEYEYICAASLPKCSSQVKIGTEYVVQSILEPHAVQLIELQRMSGQ
jgi:hypothetical protein